MQLLPPAMQMKRAKRERMTALYVAAHRCRLAPMWHKPPKPVDLGAALTCSESPLRQAGPAG